MSVKRSRSQVNESCMQHGIWRLVSYCMKKLGRNGNSVSVTGQYLDWVLFQA